jgi:hypothetical protein
MDDHIGLDGADRCHQGVAVGYVECALLRSDDLEGRTSDALGCPAVKLGGYLGAELTGHAGHEHTHARAA